MGTIKQPYGTKVFVYQWIFSRYTLHYNNGNKWTQNGKGIYEIHKINPNRTRQIIKTALGKSEQINSRLELYLHHN